MMGLLDSNDLTDDTLQQGLLSLGFRLMSTPGKFLPAFGQAGLGAMGDLQAAARDRDARKRAGLQDQMLMMQMEQAKRQQAAQEAAAARKMRDDELLAGAFRPMPGPMPDGSAGVTPRFDVRSLLGSGLSMDSVPQAINLQQALNPPRKLTTYRPGDQARDEAGNVAFEVPHAPEKPSAFAAAMAEAGILPGSDLYKTRAMEHARKLATHAPASTMNNFGSPVAGTDPSTGKPAFAVTDKQGNVKLLTGVTPPAKALPEKQQAQVVGVQNTRNAITEYRTELEKWKPEDIASPDARARMGTKYHNMMLQAKEAYNLGVLNGPDLQILQSVITNPASFTGAFTSKKAMDDQARELSRIMSAIANVASQSTPRGGGGDTTVSNW